MNLALEKDCESVYATTVAASGILEQLGWRLVQTVLLGDEQLALNRCELDKIGSTQ